VKKSEFVHQLSEYCEFENQELTLDTPLKSIEGYDSFAIMSMIAFADENFSMKLTAQQIIKLTDFNSLIELLGEDKFENE
jgi:acyl carrier protein